MGKPWKKMKLSPDEVSIVKAIRASLEELKADPSQGDLYGLAVQVGVARFVAHGNGQLGYLMRGKAFHLVPEVGDRGLALSITSAITMEVERQAVMMREAVDKVAEETEAKLEPRRRKGGEDWDQVIAKGEAEINEALGKGRIH